ncbi:MAG: WD40 repeat domain-containing protein [Candidatus Magnetominusculus sp. LBB02]|nr:WD40 repeat domain-containing protein [Candidatus Magnetominusculus sp. LBB02]
MNDGRVYVYDLNSDAPSGIYLKEQRSAVTAIDISGNKRLIAVGLNGGGIAVVDFNTGQIIHIFGVSGAVSGSATGNVAAVRFLPGTIYLISAHDDGSVRVWDVKNLKAVGAYKTDKTPITALVISHDLKYVYTSHKGSPPRKWETKTGKLALNFSDHAGGSPTIAVSADGKLAATGSGDCAILWDAETGKPLEKLRGHSSAVVYAGFSADGRYIVSADETVVRIWDLKTRLVYRIIKLTGSAKCAAISQLDNRLIVSTGNDITLLNFDNAYALSYTLVEPAVIRESEISYEFTRRLAEAKEKLTHSDFIGAAILISAMRTLSGYEHNPEAVELLTSVPLAYKRTNPKTGWLLNNYPSSGAITNVLSITSDGRYLIEAGSDGMVRKVDASTGEIVTEIGTDGSSAASMAADFMSRLICTGTEDGNVVVIDLAASVLVNKFSRHKGPVKAVAMAADGRYCFSAASEKTIRVWDTQDGYLGRFEECAAAVTALALHKDERIVISGMEDGTVVFWDSVTGKAVASVACHAGAVISIALSGSGQYGLSAAEDGLVGLWNIKSSKLIRQFHTDDLNCLSAAFCPSNEYLFACGTMEGTIYIYSVEGDECLFRLTGHRDGVNALAFSPNGYYLYSACLDATVARWFIEWEPTAEENSSAAEPLKRIITQYLASENSEDSDKLKTIISAAGLGHMTGSAFELTKNQVAKGTVRKSVRRQPLIQEEIAAAPTAAEVKIKVETTRLKGVIAAIVLIVACVGAVLLMYNMKRTRYNTSQLTDLVKTDDYFALVYDAVKFMDKHPAGCNPSNIDIYKESYAVFIKKGRAVVSGLQPKSLENIGCLISLRSDKVVVANLIDEMVADPVNSQGLSVLLSYMGGDVIPQLTEFLGNERFVKGNEAGAKLVVSTLAAMTTGDASSALANLVSGNPYLGPAAAPHLGRIFSTKQLEPDKALQLIETLMMSQDEKVRKDAVSALIFIKGSRAKGILQKAASDSSATVSKEASKVLASF